jgi:phenylacetate 2-hydroxylase
MRLGDRRAIVANTFSTVKDLFVGFSHLLIDRPQQPGFVDKLGLDVTGSRMTESVRRCRQAGMRALGKPKWPSYYPLLEPSSVSLVRNLFQKGQNGKVPTDLYPYLVQIMFDLAMSLTYGCRLADVDEEFGASFLEALNTITAIRASTRYYRHYVPFLRLIPERTSEVMAAEKVRKARLWHLYDLYKQRTAQGEKVNCVVESLGTDKLTEDEIHATCLSLLQAAPETVATAFYMAVGWLSSPVGQTFQPEALAAILEAYDGNRDLAWEMAFKEEKIPLIISLTKETLRLYPPSPYGLPRETTSDIQYMGTTVPKGVTVYMNTQKANLDESWYGEDAKTFNPRRFLSNETSLPHLSFGAGSRICPAVGITNRIMNALLVRLILAFEMKEPEGEGARKPHISWQDWSDVYDSLVTIPRTFDCTFIARDEQWLEQILI